MEDPSEPREDEAALIIRDDHPEKVAERLARLSSVAGYRLKPGATQHLHDRYLDTPNGRLAAKRLALRIRQLDGSSLITLKGPSRAMPWGTKERLEIEETWSRAALHRVAAELRREDVPLPMPPSRDWGPPLAILERLGFRVVQDRETERTVRQVISGGVAAELAIDLVTYHTGTTDVRMYEVEVEAKRPDVSNVLDEVIHALDREWPELQLWPYSKIATGMGLARLLSRGEGRDALNDRAVLTPRGIDGIALVLRDELSGASHQGRS